MNANEIYATLRMISHATGLLEDAALTIKDSVKDSPDSTLTENCYDGLKGKLEQAQAAVERIQSTLAQFRPGGDSE